MCAVELWRDSRSRSAGTATGCATTTRSHLVAAFARARQAGVRRLPRPAADQRGATAARCYQDIDTQRPRPGAASRCRERTTATSITVEFVPGTRLAQLYSEGTPGPRSTASTTRRIKDLAAGFEVEARCPSDGMIEAIRAATGPTFMAAVQWHPEFHRAGDGTLDDAALLDDFLAAAARRSRQTMTHDPARDHQPRHRRADRRAAGRRRRERRRQGRRAPAPRSRPGRRGRWPSARPASRTFAPASCATSRRWPRP